jgi:hypothetical protein
VKRPKTHAPHKLADRALCCRRHVLVVVKGESPTCKHCAEIIRDTHEDLL